MSWRPTSLELGVAAGALLFYLSLCELNRWHLLPRAVNRVRAWRRRWSWRAHVVTATLKAVEEQGKLRGRILSVGDLTITDRGELVFGEGWEIDCTNGTPVYCYDADGVWRFCGYTREELLEIQRNPREHVVHR